MTVALILTGSPGAGKSSVLEALTTQLEIDGVEYSALESEQLAWGSPWLSAEQWLPLLAAVTALQRDVGRRLFLIAATPRDPTRPASSGRAGAPAVGSWRPEDGTPCGRALGVRTGPAAGAGPDTGRPIMARKTKLTQAQREQRRAEDRHRLEQAARALLSSDGWARWVRVRATSGLARYSLLI